MRYVETSVFLHWLTKNRDYGERSYQIIKEMEMDEKGVTSSVTFVELSSVLGRTAKGFSPSSLVEAVLSLHNLSVYPFDQELLKEAAAASRRYGITLAEGIHYATAERARCTKIYSTNPNFGRTPIRRVF